MGIDHALSRIDKATAEALNPVPMGRRSCGSEKRALKFALLIVLFKRVALPGQNHAPRGKEVYPMFGSYPMCRSNFHTMARLANLALATVIVLAPGFGFTQRAYAQDYTLTLLYSFQRSPDGQWPLGIVLDPQGNFYGATQYGGLSSCGPFRRPLLSCGTVFKLDGTGQETVLHAFTAENGDGMNPGAGVIVDGQGNLYGVTQFGGDPLCFPGGEYFGCGIVFKLDPSGEETMLHIFEGPSQGDGAAPGASLVQDGQGNLYGTTSYGGDGGCIPHNGEPGCGTVFKLDPAGHETVLYRFTEGSGEVPSGVILDEQGNLYGTTVYGGDYGYGTVFKLDASGNFTVLHSFQGLTNGAVFGDGANPGAALVRDAQGNLYGTTFNGGGDSTCFDLSPGCGTVFKVSASGEETILYDFTATGDAGYFPYSALVLDSAGNLYGFTLYVRYSDTQIAFKLDPSGHATVLYSFDGAPEPFDLVPVPGQDGSFYGALYMGGANGAGAIFELAPSAKR